MARQSKIIPMGRLSTSSLGAIGAAAIVLAVILAGLLVAADAHSVAPIWGNDPAKPQKPPKVEPVTPEDGEPRWVGPQEVRERLARCYPTCRSHKGKESAL